MSLSFYNGNLHVFPVHSAIIAVSRRNAGESHVQSAADKILICTPSIQIKPDRASVLARGLLLGLITKETISVFLPAVFDRGRPLLSAG